MKVGSAEMCSFFCVILINTFGLFKCINYICIGNKGDKFFE